MYQNGRIIDDMNYSFVLSGGWTIVDDMNYSFALSGGWTIVQPTWFTSVSKTGLFYQTNL